MKIHEARLRAGAWAALMTPVVAWFVVFPLTEMIALCLLYGSEAYFTEGLRMIDKHGTLSNGSMLPNVPLYYFLSGVLLLGIVLSVIYGVGCLVVRRQERRSHGTREMARDDQSMGAEL